MIDKSREPFSVRQKDFWDIGQSRSLLSPKFAASLLHEPDGLIFQPSIMVRAYIFFKDYIFFFCIIHLLFTAIHTGTMSGRTQMETGPHEFRGF